jgi:hypothetical protein
MKIESGQNKGWVAIWRKIIDSEIWLQEPWRLRVWLYFIAEANHCEELRYGQKLRRGQFHVSSIPDLCRETRWKKGYISKQTSVNSMKQFWKWLRKEKMIDTKKTTRGTIITILNYAKYQDISNKSVDTEEHPVIDTNGTPEVSHDRQPPKPLEQLNKEESPSVIKLSGETLKNEMRKQGKTPYYHGNIMRWKDNKWWVVENGEWLEFADSEKTIEWRPLYQKYGEEKTIKN